MNPQDNRWRGWVALACAGWLVLTSGCATYKDQASTMSTAWASGNYAAAARDFSSRARKQSNGKDAVIWNLEAGAALRAIGDYTNSNRHFDIAAAAIDRYEQAAKVRVGQEALATFSNQQNLPYEGRPYDKIMLHTYKALNFLAVGDVDRARPEVIRMYQRQQDAVAENRRRIEQAQAAERASKDPEAIARTKADPTFNQAVNGLSQNLVGFRAYADYVNPFSVYLDGLYFLHAGGGASDLERAIKSLNRVIEVAGENRFVAADVRAASDLLRGQRPPPLTYVIFENGRGASRDQVRIDIPIIFADVSYVGAAFPKLVFHEGQLPAITVTADGVQETTQTVSSMDAVIAQDFKNELPAIVTRTVIATLAKGAAAYAANRAAWQQSGELGMLVRIATAVAQMAVNIADTRSWTTLPKEFQVARINTPASRQLTVAAPGGQSLNVALIDGVVNVVYVKSVSAGTPLLVSQFKLR
ncbi:MAG: hypothetical protein IPM17_06275 [Verrucomicrobia bacterium]|nr:hypothetical protein [Verrucomicrobiota bacterium]